MIIDENKYYPLHEAAVMLRVTQETVKKYCRKSGKGNLPGKQVGPKKRWHVLGKGISAKLKEWQVDDWPNHVFLISIIVLFRRYQQATLPYTMNNHTEAPIKPEELIGEAWMNDMNSRKEFEEGLTELDVELKPLSDALIASERLSEEDLAVRINTLD